MVQETAADDGAPELRAHRDLHQQGEGERRAGDAEYHEDRETGHHGDDDEEGVDAVEVAGPDSRVDRLCHEGGNHKARGNRVQSNRQERIEYASVQKHWNIVPGNAIN